MSVELANQWIKKAKNDLLNADNNLKSTEVPYDTVCFHCQQAAEKLLKAYLSYYEEITPRTHDLLALLESILKIQNSVYSLREIKDYLVILNPYAVEIRYPDDWSMPTPEDTQEARDAAGHIYSKIKSILPNLFT